jgi:hypothetical protein
MSTRWIIPTRTDLEDVMTALELELAKKHVSITKVDRVPGILANLVAEIRGNIATWAPNTLSANTAKIPPAFLARAMVLARGRVLTGIPNYTQDDDRKKENEEAETYFRMVARGTIRPEPADDAIDNPVPNEKPAGVEIVSAPGSRTGRERMDGI